MSDEDIKKLIAQISRLEGKVCSEIVNLKNSYENLRDDVKEIFGKIDLINQTRPCDTCEVREEVSEFKVSRLQLKGIWGAISLIFIKIFWEWWAKK